MINPRHSAAVAILLAFALAPTVIHSYLRVTVADGRRAAALPAVLDGMPSSRTDRRPGWVANNFDSDDWVERVYRVDRDTVTLFVARSYDAKRLYHHPELALLKGLEPTPAGRHRVARRPAVPLHVLTTTGGGRSGVAVYALLYDGRFVDNAVLFQLQTATELLFSGRRPMTLFMASDLAGSVDRLDDAPATRVLLAAIASFEQQAPATANR